MKQDDWRTKWFIDLNFVTFDSPLERLHVHETGFWFVSRQVVMLQEYLLRKIELRLNWTKLAVNNLIKLDSSASTLRELTLRSPSSCETKYANACVAQPSEKP